jgi:hypothetical protein
MNEILKLATSPVWWISVVIVGILINLLSAYLKPPLDDRFGRISTWWRVRSKTKGEAWAKEVERLRASSEGRIAATIEEFRSRLWMMSYLLFLIMFLLMLTVPLPHPLPNAFRSFILIAGALTLALVLAAHNRAARFHRLIREALSKDDKSPDQALQSTAGPSNV